MNLQTTEEHQPDNESRIAEILNAWIARRELGNAEPAELLIRNHPELGTRFRQCVESIELLSESRLQSPPTPQYPEIPDFEIVGELGRGGMGIVYEAKQASLDRSVALKILPITTADPLAADRFRREAETAAALHHTNIVPIHAVGQNEGVHWYAMQRIDGVPLNDLLRGSPNGVDPDEVARIGIEAADALAHAHHHGVVHRDIKPANLLIEDGGHVWLTDFGLARRDLDTGATASGALIGTPRYMSPEQVFAPKGVALDHRCDIYSLGATLYELVTGSVLFDGNTPLDVLQQIRTAEPIRARDVRRTVPRDLEIVLQKCLAKDPRERYQSAQELATDLRAVREGRAIRAKGVPFWVQASRRLARHREMLKIAAAVFAATAALFLIVTGWLTYQEIQRTGAIQVDSSSGPYVGALYAIDPDGTTNPISAKTFTVPMQEPVHLAAGNYKLNLTSHGRKSVTSNLSVFGNELVEARVIGKNRSKGAPIENVPLWPIRIPQPDGQDLETVGVLDKQEFRVIGQDASELVRIDASEIKPDEEPDGGASWIAEFTHIGESEYAGNVATIDPYYCRPMRVMPTAIDLNEDQRPDFVLTAKSQPALAAISNDSTVLWAKKILLPDHADQNSRRRYFIPYISEVHPTEDLNDDGVDDLIVNISRTFDRKEVEPFIVSVSGRTGETIAVARLPTRVPNPNRPIADWPTDGILVRSSENESRELQSNSYHQGKGIHRAGNGIQQEVKFIVGSFGRNLPFTPPLKVCRWKDHTVAVASTLKTLSMWDVATGEQVGDTMELPFPIAASPVQVDLGHDSPPSFLIWSRAQAFASVALVVLGKPNPIWTRDLSFDWEGMASQPNRPDFPIHIDLDGDGCDEIILPATNVTSYETGGKLVCLNAKTGKSIWNQPPKLNAYERQAERATVLRDFDNDGFRDIATVTLSGRYSISSPWNAKSNTEGHYRHRKESFAVFLDLYSGATGEHLGWKMATIDPPHSDLEIAGVDRLCSDEKSVVEASVVVGGHTEDQLHSQLVRFDLESDGPPHSTIGLSRIGSYQSDTRSGYYLQRPGFDEQFQRSIVWQDFDDSDVADQERLDANDIIAHWTDRSGKMRMLMRNGRSKRMMAIDVASGETLWSRVFASSQLQATPVLDRNQLTKSILLHSDRELPPQLIDADSGTPRWSLARVFGQVEQANLIEKDGGDTIQIYVHRGYIDFGGTTNDRGLELMHVNANTGNVQWQVVTLRGMLARSPIQPLRLMIHRTDCNGDGVLDYVVPDDGDDAVALSAISGVDGKRLWQADTGLPFDYWPSNLTWPMIIKCGPTEKSAIVFLGLHDRANYVLNMIKASTGEIVDKVTLPFVVRRRTAPTMIGRDGFFSLDRLDDSTWPGVALKYPDGNKNTTSRTWRTFQVSEAGFENADTGGQSIEHNEEWFHVDVDNDGVAERCVAKDQTLHCSEIAGDQLWRTDIEDWKRLEVLGDATGSLPFSRIEYESGDREIVDLRSGKITFRCGPKLQTYWRSSKRYDVAALSNPTGVSLVEVKRNRIAWKWIPVENSVAASPASPAKLSSATIDPRYQHQMPTSVIPRGQSFHSFVGEIARSILLAFFATFLPGLYLGRMTQRFSLSFLMLSPVVGVLSILAWQTLFTPSMNVARANDSPWYVLFTGLVLLLSVWILVHYIRYGNRWILGTMTVVTVSLTLAFLGLPLLMESIINPTSNFEFDAIEILVVFVGALSTVLFYGSPIWWLMKRHFERAKKSEAVA